MKFEDPKKYLQRPNEFTDYVMGLYFEYKDVVYDMYNRLAPLFPEIPPQTIYVETIGGIDENLGRSINGMSVPLNKIHIYLYSIAIAAFDDCIDFHRNDIDTVFKANLAFTLMHEMSHAAQFTYVPESMRNAMEYANDRHVYEYMIPIAASMLKKQYKINVLKDRVDSSVTKVYSYPYQSMNTQWEQLVNYIVYNSIPKSSFTLTPVEKFRCEADVHRNIRHHRSKRSTPSVPYFSRLLRAFSTGFSRSRWVFEKNLSAKQITCSSGLTGTMSRCGTGRFWAIIWSNESPAPVWRSHTRAWRGYPSLRIRSAPR